MVNLTTANSALKTVYLDVLDNLLNVSTNPLFAKIKKTTKGVTGKEIKVLAPYGFNGGITATSETGGLPSAGGNNYVNFTSELKNLYGCIEISDKAVRASQNSAGAFVNLLNDEMEGLIQSSAFNLSRMIYSDGYGLLSEIVGAYDNNTKFAVKDVTLLLEGMIVDIFDDATGDLPETSKGYKIVKIDRNQKLVTLDRELVLDSPQDGGYYFVIQNSFNNELTGIHALFNPTIKTLYGLSKEEYPFMQGLNSKMLDENDLTDMYITEIIDNVEDWAGTQIDFIACSSKARRHYQNLLLAQNRNIQTINLGNGFKALDFYGIPMYSDRLVPQDRMFMIDTDQFTLHQMCDWEWLADESGNVLSQKAGYPVYTATLVKYADLICSKPSSKFKSLMFRPFKKCRKIRGFSDFRFPKNCKIDISLCKF